MLRANLFTVFFICLMLGSAWGVRVIAQEAAIQDAAQAKTQTDAGGLSGAQRPLESAPETSMQGGEDFDFFSDAPVQGAEVIELPPEKSAWITVGAPLALLALFFLILAINWWWVPFTDHSVELNLRDLPPAAKRGIAMAVVMFGFAFCFGASEIWYQLQLHGSAEAYFAQMSLGKLIAFTHAHLFGFTTCFFIIGIPFSMQFNHIPLYQWMFPVGLAASVIDVMSWWGIKYLTPNFEWISMLCGILFSVTYLWMLIGLLRVLLFPDVIWSSDKDAPQRLAAKRELEQAARHNEGDY